MKTPIIRFILLGMVVLATKAVTAINPVELISLIVPAPTATINVTVDLGQFDCPALQCTTWYCKPQYEKNGNYTDIGGSWPFVYGGPTTHTWTGLTVDDYSDYICVYWYFSGSCTRPHNPVRCCVPYKPGVTDYNITCNPCEQ